MANDLFVAIPTSAAGNSVLAGNYSVAYMNFPDGLAMDTTAAGFQIAPKGTSSIGTVTKSALARAATIRIPNVGGGSNRQ